MRGLSMSSGVAMGVILSCALSACGKFDDPSSVYDLRVLGAIAKPPEILIPVGTGGIALPQLPSEFPSIEICALIADPGGARDLFYEMVACPKTPRGRCDSSADSQPQIVLGSGMLAASEEKADYFIACETLVAMPALRDIIEQSISLDSLSGFGAIDIQVAIEVWPSSADRDQAIYATKKVRFGSATPQERTANLNPSLRSTVATRVNDTEKSPFDLPLGHCGEVDAPVVAPGEELEILPLETEGTREEYVVPTLDGEVRHFTEILDYRFYATQGHWSKNRSGGERDISGMLPPLDTHWVAPTDPAVIGSGLDVGVYVVQRDERGGQSWALSCLHVVP